MQNDTVSTTQNAFSAKDLFVPLAIVLAGLFIGAGLYFGGFGGPTVDNTVQNNPSAPAVAEQDATNLVAPVTEADHIRGNLSAPIKIVEYSDFDCPFCSRFHDTMKVVVEKYSGDKVAWVYRHFPIPQLHPQAEDVANASECVAELGGTDAFWKFTDAYYATRGAGDRTVHAELIPKLALEAGVAKGTFDSCFSERRHAGAVKEDLDNGVATGGKGTPWAILIGPSGKTYPISGALPIEAIEQVIQIAETEA